MSYRKSIYAPKDPTIYKHTKLLVPLRDLDHEAGGRTHPRCYIRCVPPMPSDLSMPLHLSHWDQLQFADHSAGHTSGLRTSTPSNCHQNSRLGHRRDAVSVSFGGSEAIGHGPSVDVCLFPARRPRQTSPRNGTGPGRVQDPLAVENPIEAAPNSAIPADRHGERPCDPHPVPHRQDYAGPVRWHCPTHFYLSAASFSAI